jgi:hypothetical protein
LAHFLFATRYYIEKELVQELDAYKSGRRSTSNISRPSGSSSSSAAAKSLTAKLDAHIKNIENERDYFRQEVDTLQTILKATQCETQQKLFATTTMSVVDCDGNNDGKQQQQQQQQRRSGNSTNHSSRHEEIGSAGSISNNRSRSPASKSQTRCSVCASRLGSSGGGKNSPSRVTTTTQVTTKQQHHHHHHHQTSASVNNINEAVRCEEIKQLRRERDELKCLLDKFERHMAEIQSNVKCLTGEKDKYMQMYEEAKEEIRQTRCELMKTNSKSSNVSLATQALLKRVENERDTAIFDLRSTLDERDSLKDRLRVSFFFFSPLEFKT